MKKRNTPLSKAVGIRLFDLRSQPDKANAEVLKSRLNKWNLLDSSCQATVARKDVKGFQCTDFSVKNDLCFCNDADNLFQEMGICHKPNEWHPVKFLLETVD